MKSLKLFFGELFGELDVWGKVFLYVGLLGLACAIGMVADYGAQVSVFHAGFLIVICMLTAFGPHAVLHVWEKGKKVAAVIVALTMPWLFQQEFQSHAIYTAGLRGSNVAEAQIMKARYDGAQKSSGNEQTNLDMWRARLSSLTADREKMGTELTWLPTVTPDGLRAEIVVHDKEIALETARGGCKAKCAQRMAAKADLEKRISAAEAFKSKSDEIASLNKQIDSTQKILDAKVADAAKVDYKPSAVDMGAKFLSKLVAMRSGSLKASDLQVEGTDQYQNLSLALSATLAPAIGFFLAGLFRLPRSAAGSHSYTPAVPASPRLPAPASHTREVIVRNDESFAARMRDAFNSGALPTPRTL